MYGFRKTNQHTNDVTEVWEFIHPSFKRTQIHGLYNIKRKTSAKPSRPLLNRPPLGTAVETDEKIYEICESFNMLLGEIRVMQQLVNRQHEVLTDVVKLLVDVSKKVDVTKEGSSLCYTL